MWNTQFSASCVAVIFILSLDILCFEYGPNNGPERCSGKFQIPIDTSLANVQRKKFPYLDYSNLDAIAKNVHMTNNGHTVLVTMDFERGRVPRLRGGPVMRNSSYQFEQFYFHWGTTNAVGSKDLVNNRAFSVEVHVVIRSLDYKDLESALRHDHGIAMLAFYFEIGQEDNPYYAEFVEKLSTIIEKGQSTKLEKPMSLMKFLTKNFINYYSYEGSLTTPPCSQEVVWMDFEQPIPISEHQLNHFRKLAVNDDQLQNNYRSPESVKDYIIYEDMPDLPDYAIKDNNAIPFVDAENVAATNSYNAGGKTALLLATIIINSL